MMITEQQIKELERSPYYVSFLGQGDDKPTFVRVKDYSQLEFDAFCRARDAISDSVLQFMDLYKMVAIVYDNLVKAHEKRIEEVKAQGNVHARDDLVEINAYFVSLIANFATYIGCVPREISSKRQAILDIHNEATHEEFDGSFAYRLFCSLRNYTLHDKPPIRGIKGSSRMSKTGDKVEVAYEVYIEKSKLIKNSTVANKLANDFASPPDNYPVIELATDAMLSLKNIHWKTMKALLASIEHEVALIETLVALRPKNQLFIASFPYNIKTKEIDAKLELIPADILEIKTIASKY
jgi:hypothetical protein